MTRRRWRITLLAAAATLAALYPITSLFTSNDWLPKAALVIAVVAAVGALLRGLTRSRVLVPVVQLVAAGYVALAMHAWWTFRFGIPTGRTLDVLGELSKEALETISRYAVPAPFGEGVSFWIVLAVALVATCVDAMAATWRSPAAAGLPLLTAYLITAANGNAALELRYFVVPVALWLAMLHTSARAQFGRWSTTTASDAHGHDIGSDDASALRSLSLGAAKLGTIGIVVALAVPVLVPHFPPRYLVDGLGRTSAGGSGSVGYSNTVDLTRSLNNSDPTPLLRYTTTGVANVPLRVVATSFYSRGQWLPSSREGAAQTELPPASQRRDYVMTVTDNQLDAPRVAAPYPVIALTMDGTDWKIDPITRDIHVTRPVSSYKVTYSDLAPLPALLRGSGEISSSEVLEDDLALPSSSRDQITAWAARVVGTASNPLDKAIAIQAHLRDTTTYTYSLNVGQPEREEDGRPVDPVLTFEKTKRGYCIHFASAMILMARAQGIPARMAIGFLPGARSGDSWVVRNSDAHAWPELYFQGYGWLRFEPTPGSRSGTPPPYTQQGASGSSTGGGRAVDDTETSGATNRPVTKPDNEVAQPGAGTSSGGSGFQLLTLRGLSLLASLVVIVLAVLVMPLTAWLARVRRRRRAATQQELVEIEWDALTSRLSDLGLSAPSGATLRGQRDRYISDGHLDEANAGAMRRVTATLERARYDRPERTTADETSALHRDIRSVRRQVIGTRSWSTRVRSFLWPTAGVTVWRRLLSRRSR